MLRAFSKCSRPSRTTCPLVRSFSMASSRPIDMEAAYAHYNPIDVYRSQISHDLAPITGKQAEEIYEKLAWTQTMDKGDLGLPVPSLRIQGKKPNEQATDFAEKYPENALVEKPTTNGPFLQFYFKPQPLTQLIIPSILKKKQDYGSNDTLGLKDPKDPAKGQKTIIVEFSSPNIAKPFHAGHLRSTIIGGFLANLYETAGWKVIRMNYLGDWGRQFGLLANAFKEYGSEDKLQQDPIGHLFDIYVEINKKSGPEENEIKLKKEQLKQLEERKEDASDLEAEITALEAKSENEKARQYFKRLENGDKEALAVWSRFRDLSIDRYQKTYARLNIHYDVYSGESQVEMWRMERAVDELEKSGLSENSKGAIIVDLTKSKDKNTKKLGKALVRKTDGSSLYLTRDLGEAVKRDELYHFDKMIYVVSSQQDVHVQQLFKILELMGRKDTSDKCVFVNFGMVLGMSTRKGTVKFLDDILRDVGDNMHDVMKRNEKKYEQVENPKQTADILGISAVMVQDMKGKRYVSFSFNAQYSELDIHTSINNYEFSLEQMCSFEGDTGPYLQYAHARLCSITRKAGLTPQDLVSADLSLLTESHAINLVRVLASWPDMVQQTLKTLEPTTVLTYLFKMTHMLSSSYDVLQVVGSEPEVKKARMALYEAARQVLNNGMIMLGLSPVERSVGSASLFLWLLTCNRM